MVRASRYIAFSLAAAAASASPALAQALNQPNPVQRLLAVTQFGMPRDTKFVFCEGVDCPERSLKHLNIPPLAQAHSPPPRELEPAAQSPPLTQPEAEAQKPASKAIKKKPARKKRRIKCDCKPIPEAK